MADESRFGALSLLVSVAFAPGVLGHEYAHVVACRLFDVEVRSVRPLNLLAGYAEVVHERVDGFAADLAIGLAPLALNSVAGAACFLLAARLRTGWPLPSTLVTWAGVTCTITAFPSRYDTETLLRTSSDTDGAARVLAIPLALAVRGATVVPYVAGVYGFAWTAVLYGWATAF